MSTDVLVVSCAFPAAGDAAAKAAHAIVSERLAACVNIVSGVQSVYRWKGVVQKDDETLLVIKTTVERFAALKVRLIELHTYDTPEVIALEVERGHIPYLDWVSDSVRPD
ncbi:MAG TPA: divalent-cation tolerance protein CutA [Kofleriaceae bacterium]|nr:divalent-cation tolerance protein CutA [Kofleriaceae bacterium]